MTEHLENTPANRFFAFWWGLGGVLVFGVLVLIAGRSGGAGGGGTEEFEAQRAQARGAKLAEVREAQARLLSAAGEAVEASPGRIRVPAAVAAKSLAVELGAGVPRVTAVPVPGTAAALELMKNEAAAAQVPAAPPAASAPSVPPATATPAAPPKSAAAPAAEKAPEAAPQKPATAVPPASEPLQKAPEKAPEKALEKPSEKTPAAPKAQVDR